MLGPARTDITNFGAMVIQIFGTDNTTPHGLLITVLGDYVSVSCARSGQGVSEVHVPEQMKPELSNPKKILPKISPF